MTSHPLYILVFVTMAAVIGIAAWSYLSTKGHDKNPNEGLGGPNDPLG